MKIRLLLVVMVMAVCFGCEENRLGRKAVSGSINFKGQSLDSGSIQFSPHGHQGVASGGIIDRGRYVVPRDKGLPPGKYLVRIFSPEDVVVAPEQVTVPGAVADQGPRQPPPAEERIPPDYNLESKQIIEVTADGDNVFDFDIGA